MLLAGTLFVRGIGLGLTMMPVTAAAYVGLTHAEIPKASTTMNIVRQVGGSVATALFALTLPGLYFTPLYEWSLRYGVLHAWIHVHFVVVGVLFAEVVVGLDVNRHRTAHPARLGLVLSTVPLHAFLGVALDEEAVDQVGPDEPRTSGHKRAHAPVFLARHPLAVDQRP